MEVHKKLQEARKLMKESDMKKQGYNEYSKYYYYTPDQVAVLVYTVEQKLNLFHKFDLISNEGIYAVITIYDLDSGKSLEFKILTDIPAITATNKTQQLGGAVTYSNRYLLMSIYDIQDNNLDFDTDKKQTDNKKQTETKKEAPKLPWLNTGTKEWKNAVEKLKDGTITIEEIKEYYTINKVNTKTLTELKTK